MRNIEGLRSWLIEHETDPNLLSNIKICKEEWLLLARFCFLTDGNPKKAVSLLKNWGFKREDMIETARKIYNTR